jgi:hypothetical protein
MRSRTAWLRHLLGRTRVLLKRWEAWGLAAMVDVFVEAWPLFHVQLCKVDSTPRNPGVDAVFADTPVVGDVLHGGPGITHVGTPIRQPVEGKSTSIGPCTHTRLLA